MEIILDLPFGFPINNIIYQIKKMVRSILMFHQESR